MAEATPYSASRACPRARFRAVPGEPWTVDQVLVVAHLDDESFGLGGVIVWLVDHSVRVDLVCFTAGETSTVGVPDALGVPAALGAVRAKELHAPAAVLLGIRDARLEGMADGTLTGREADMEEVIEGPLGDAGALVCLEPSARLLPRHRLSTSSSKRQPCWVGTGTSCSGAGPTRRATGDGQPSRRELPRSSSDS